MKVEEIVKKIQFLKPLSPAGKKAMQLLNDPNSSIDDIKDTILLDPALTADVLRISNSAFFALRQKVTSVRHAIVILGRKNLKRILLTAQMGSVLKNQLKGYPTQDNTLWEHSLVAAVSAELIAERLGFSDKEQAYIGGLLHDMGKIILDPYVKKSKEEIEQRLKEGQNILAIEKQLFGFNHAEVGGMIAESWDLPLSIKEAITYHHNPTEAKEEVMLALITYLANNLAGAICPVGFITEPSSDSKLLQEVGLTPADTEEITLKILAAKEEILDLT